MLDSVGICGVPERFGILLFAFDAWFWCYLSWPDTFLEAIAFLRCSFLMLFVVAGGTFESHWLPSMLDFDAICGVPEHLAAFDAWSWCYLSWPEVLLQVIAFLRWLQMFASWLIQLWLELQLQYLVCLPSILDFDGCFFMFLSWFLGRIQQMCERNYVRFVNDFRLMLVCFGLFWIVSTKHIVANLTYLLQALAIVCFVKRYCRMSDWSCSYNIWIAAKRKVDVWLIMCWVSDIVSGEDVMMNR